MSGTKCGLRRPYLYPHSLLANTPPLPFAHKGKAASDSKRLAPGKGTVEKAARGPRFGNAHELELLWCLFRRLMRMERERERDRARESARKRDKEMQRVRGRERRKDKGGERQERDGEDEESSTKPHTVLSRAHHAPHQNRSLTPHTPCLSPSHTDVAQARAQLEAPLGISALMSRYHIPFSHSPTCTCACARTLKHSHTRKHTQTHLDGHGR